MIPESLPDFEIADFDGLEQPSEIAARLLAPFFEGDPLGDQLPEICAEALNFPIPLRTVGAGTEVLELFHGPTAAFKDVGARFLAQCLSRMPDRHERTRTVLVATSGDTGGAVGAALEGLEGTEVVILFPTGRVSSRQEHQLTCWDDNVRSFEVDGSFDDCQNLIKRAFVDPELASRHRLSAANSINLGRMLPQVAYHAAASLWHHRAHGARVRPGVLPVAILSTEADREVVALDEADLGEEESQHGCLKHTGGGITRNASARRIRLACRGYSAMSTP
jgi:threonine synthase